MSSASLPEISMAGQDYARIWAENAARILEQFHGSAVTATLQTPIESEIPSADSGETLWINFKVSGELTGNQAFQFSASDGVRMAQMLMSEPVDGAAALNEGYRDALSELFRQFAGVAATACKTEYGGAVELQLDSALPPEWKPAAQASWIFAAPQLSPLQWKFLFNQELHAALIATQKRQPQNVAPQSQPQSSPSQATSGVAAARTSASSQNASQPSGDSKTGPAESTAANLDLLLDVELEATLRFGQREMLLREILDLRPGSVVELNRQLQDPAELLVSGRVIARGEVVIVDGNYGLRITDIIQPQKRLESLRT